MRGWWAAFRLVCLGRYKSLNSDLEADRDRGRRALLMAENLCYLRTVSKPIAVVVFIWFLGSALWFVPFTWRTGHMNRSGQPPKSWPYGQAAWLAYPRMMPAGAIGMVLACGSFLASGTLSGALLVAAVALLTLAVTAAILNRPKAVVPPTRRGDPALSSIWSAAVRSRFDRSGRRPGN